MHLNKFGCIPVKKEAKKLYKDTQRESHNTQLQFHGSYGVDAITSLQVALPVANHPLSSAFLDFSPINGHNGFYLSINEGQVKYFARLRARQKRTYIHHLL